MKIKLYGAIIASFLVLTAAYLFWNRTKSLSLPPHIYAFNYDTDAAAVTALFHKGDNWYWMIHTQMHDSYNLDHVLLNASSSQQLAKRDLVMRVYRKDNNIVGFGGYYQVSANVWKILFLLVDQDYRKQGIARALLSCMMNEVKARGARQVLLYTRNNNFRSQALYTSVGFKTFHQEADGVEMSYNF